MQTVKAAELVLDFDLYPRPQVDGYHVNQIAEAIKLGVEMPPVVYDKKSKRVSDGFHRVRATIKVLGPEADIQAVAKTYKNDAALFEDAMRYNARHGHALTQFDKTRCLIIGERLGLKLTAIADALTVSTEKLGELRARKIATGASNGTALKTTIQHKAGETLTKPQEEANKKLGGMRQLFYVNQLILLLENDLLDRENGDLMARMTYLKTLL